MRTKRADTRTQILDTAQELIQRRGVNGMSYQDVSEAVGIRKASIHYYFASKDDMVSAVFTRYLHAFEAEADTISDLDISGIEKLDKYCALFLRALQSGAKDKGCLCGMLMAEIASLDDTSVALIGEFVRANGKRVETMLLQGVEDGSISIQGDVSEMASFVLSALEGSLLVGRCHGGPERVASDIGRLLSLLSSR